MTQRSGAQSSRGIRSCLQRNSIINVLTLALRAASKGQFLVTQIDTPLRGAWVAREIQ